MNEDEIMAVEPTDLNPDIKVILPPQPYKKKRSYVRKKNRKCLNCKHRFGKRCQFDGINYLLPVQLSQSCDEWEEKC